MSLEEVQNLSDDDLKSAWNEIKACMNNDVLKHSLSEMAKNILFVNFINVGNEMNKRKLKTG